MLTGLPHQAQCQLHDARVGRRRDAEEVGTGHAPGGKAEVRVIQRIENLEAELALEESAILGALNSPTPDVA